MDAGSASKPSLLVINGVPRPQRDMRAGLQHLIEPHFKPKLKKKDTVRDGLLLEMLLAGIYTSIWYFGTSEDCEIPEKKTLSTAGYGYT
jgi:hypothetical protein